MRARASLTHVGQSESVVRGQPSTGELFSQLFGSGAGAQAGWNDAAGVRRAAAVQTPPGEVRRLSDHRLKNLGQDHDRALLAVKLLAAGLKAAGIISCLPGPSTAFSRASTLDGTSCHARSAAPHQQRRCAWALCEETACRAVRADRSGRELEHFGATRRRRGPDLLSRWATPITQTWTTSGSSAITRSTSPGLTFRPATLTNPEVRPISISCPSSANLPRSAVRKPADVNAGDGLVGGFAIGVAARTRPTPERGSARPDSKSARRGQRDGGLRHGPAHRDAVGQAHPRRRT